MGTIGINEMARVATRLRDVEKKFAFAGACIRPLLLDEAFHGQLRPTMDVDVVIEVLLCCFPLHMHTRWVMGEWIQGLRVGMIYARISA